MAKVNISDRILNSVEELSDEIKWEDYIDRSLFTHYCDVIPNDEGERLKIGDIQEEGLTQVKGIVYVFVINGRIFKIGQSIGTFKSRLSSYNSGKKKAREKGTNGVTNFFILQSILRINLPVQVYLMTPSHSEWEVLGKKGTEAFPSAKVWEKVILEKFKEEYGKLPIGNTQN